MAGHISQKYLMIIILTAGTAAGGQAAVPSELQVLRAIPMRIVTHLKMHAPGSRDLLLGVVSKKKEAIDRGLKTIESEKSKIRDAPSLVDAARALLVLRESEFWSSYQARAETIVSSLQSAAATLANEKTEPLSMSARALFTSMDALALTAALANLPPSTEVSKFKSAGLLRFNAGTGAFDEKGKTDVDVQAEDIVLLFVYYLRFHDDEVYPVLHQAAEWELKNAKAKNASVIAEAFAYTGEIFKYNKFKTAAKKGWP